MSNVSIFQDRFPPPAPEFLPRPKPILSRRMPIRICDRCGANATAYQMMGCSPTFATHMFDKNLWIMRVDRNI